MKKDSASSAFCWLIVYRSIVVLLLALVLALLCGSFYALIRPEGSGPLFRLGGKDAVDSPGIDDGAVGIFDGIGRLRVPMDAATVLVSISFPYPAGDRPFSEELSSRVGDFRSIAAGYFSSLPRGASARFDEDAAKEEILKRYNALLRLGKIDALYFNDLMIIE